MPRRCTTIYDTKETRIQINCICSCNNDGTTGLPVGIHWQPDWTVPDSRAFDALLEQELSKSQWIIDGMYYRTLNARLMSADLVIFLDYSQWRCLLGVTRRWLQAKRGNKRPDISVACPERLSVQFLRYVYQFPQR